jgi:hypothetical protein
MNSTIPQRHVSSSAGHRSVDRLEIALHTEGFRVIHEVRGPKAPVRRWWHDDLGHPPDDPLRGLTTAEALWTLRAWEASLRVQALDRGFVLRIDTEHGTDALGQWPARLTPVDAHRGVGVLTSGSTPLSAARAALAAVDRKAADRAARRFADANTS